MKKILNCLLSRVVLVFLIIGGMLVIVSAGDTITSFKSPTTFEDLLNGEAKAGMHIKGDVAYVYDCFAEETTWKESSSGTKTKPTTSYYYYAIPGYDYVFGMKVFPNDKQQMEALANETWEYINGGANPTTKISAEGALVKMDDEVEAVFVEYLTEIGYTEQEITDMGDLLMLDQYSATNVRITFFAGCAFLGLAVLFFILRYRKLTAMGY